MAQLPPDGTYLMQQIGGRVVLFHRHTEEELVSFDPSDANATALAQKDIYDLDVLDGEQKAFFHFWSGYFYAYATSSPGAVIQVTAPVGDRLIKGEVKEPQRGSMKIEGGKEYVWLPSSGPKGGFWYEVGDRLIKDAPPTVNKVDGTVTGTLIQTQDINGDVNL